MMAPAQEYVNAEGRSIESIKKTLLHELQHAIGNKEGFASGGSDSLRQFLEQAQKRLVRNCLRL